MFKHFIYLIILIVSALLGTSCTQQKVEENLMISRADYHNQLQGFWLGQHIANWTGLVTEMDKIGNIGDIKTGTFYTRDDWGQPDHPSIFNPELPSELSANIDFVFRDSTEVWGADDDTDIEYMYQHLLYEHQATLLTPEQIREGWLTHIRKEEENFLWVANQRAFDLMEEGMLPPKTGNPEYNEHYDMIDAQLTTEIFGLFAPGRPEIGRKMAHLPIRTVADRQGAEIAEFYVTMYSLAAVADATLTMGERLHWMAGESRRILPDSSYTGKMYDFVYEKYRSGIPWEQTRDSIYQRYQVQQMDGYNITSRKLYCNGCFAGGINFASSLVSLFYGEGDLKETIKIGTLAGWDSDNPTATWGGLLGFMLGKDGVEEVFGRTFSNTFNIHRTRQNFPNDGLDTFDKMADKGIAITDKVVIELMNGKIDEENNSWVIPMPPVMVAEK